MSGTDTTGKEKNLPENTCCHGCGIELSPTSEPTYLLNDKLFCAWCWCNDCCRVSRDVAEDEKITSKDPPL